jgi:outer membrane receptor for ferrienterochelin and colicin
MRPSMKGASAVFLSLVCGTALVAQSSQTSAINGQIQNTKGEALPGASVRLTSPSLQGARIVITDGKGQFSARLLPPGAYTITVTKDGYQTATLNQVVELGQTFTPKIKLGDMAQTTVTVIASAPAIDKTDTSSTTNFTLDRITELPTGRTVEDMMALTPGVADTGATTVNGPQVRGAMSSGNRFELDGQDISDNVFGGRGVDVIDDAVDQVQIITGAIPAEYGDVDGGVINAITKTGGNEFHGTYRSIFSDAGWSALAPYQDKTTIVQKLNHIDSLTVGGYLIKDKLWFFVAGQQNQSSNSATINGGSATSAGAGYSAATNDKRIQAKLTWALNQDHRLNFSFASHRIVSTNLDYISGDLDALVPQTGQDGFWNLTWQAVWSPNLTMEAKIGKKRETLVAGGSQSLPDPVYDLTTGLFYQNGLFNAGDGGDNRDNKTADLKFTYAFSAAGDHQLDFGANYVDGTNRARNDQAPHSRYFVVLNYPAPINPLVMATFVTSTATATNESLGFYVNDRWSVNDRVTLNLGLRRDSYKASNTQNGLGASASGLSPRLGLKWDIFGDAVWQVGASYARYNAKPLDNILKQVTNAGNPTEIDYAYAGPANPTLAQATDPANYPQTVGNISNYSNPSLNVRLASGLKAPHTNEYQLSLSRAFTVSLGSGYVKATAVRRDYEDLLDYRVGNDGSVTPPPPYDVLPPSYIKVWYNDPNAKRVYKDLELEGAFNAASWDFTGNITWSSLKGNYQGEAGFAPGSGEGLQNFTVLNGTVLYSNTLTNPYGNLIGDVPLRMRFLADYHLDWALGRTTFGAIYHFDSGAHDSMTRQIAIGDVNGSIPNQASSSGYFTQYYNGERGNVVYHADAYTDIAITQDFHLFHIGETQVAAFLKLSIYNVFNHQQQLSYNNTWLAATPGVGPSDPWQPGPSYGNTQASGFWGAPRDLAVQAGFKF